MQLVPFLIVELEVRELLSKYQFPGDKIPIVKGSALMALEDKEPKLGRPFAWTAGKTLFKWFHSALGWTEDQARDRIYFAAVCRCFPGKRPTGGDRVSAPDEIANCSAWLEREFPLLRPTLVLPVGKLAIAQFPGEHPLVEMIGQKFRIDYLGHAVDCIPLPHPSGASPWHRMELGKTLLGRALALVAQ